MMTAGPSKRWVSRGVFPSFSLPNQVRIVLNFLLESIWLLAQEPAKTPAAGETGGIAAFFAQYGTLLPMLMIGVVFYLMLMRPDQKRRKEMELLLANIKKNDKVILGSGICGTVVNAAPKSVYVTIRVDDSTNTKVRVLRSAIARVGQPDETEADAKEAS